MADEVETLELAGVRIPVDPAILTPPILETIRQGKYENARLKSLRQMVEAGDRIADIGGGIGFTSALMAKEGRAAFIVSIDGHPGAVAYAARLHAANGVNVERLNALVVPVRGAAATEKFQLNRHFWGSSLLSVGKDLAEVAEVPTLTFGELIARYAPTMLVIDLEVLKAYLRDGAPGGPLEAMQLDGVNKVVVHLVQHHGGGQAVKRVFDFFSAQGFFYDFDYSRGSVVLFRRLPA